MGFNGSGIEYLVYLHIVEGQGIRRLPRRRNQPAVLYGDATCGSRFQVEGDGLVTDCLDRAVIDDLSTNGQHVGGVDVENQRGCFIANGTDGSIVDDIARYLGAMDIHGFRLTIEASRGAGYEDGAIVYDGAANDGVAYFEALGITRVTKFDGASVYDTAADTGQARAEARLYTHANDSETIAVHGNGGAIQEVSRYRASSELDGALVAGQCSGA
ncbi:hypothetical protein [Pseudomonas oryzihabitans]|uniref:hypothetical protein n=1 Tax=Pseudomonas oryzihabitans TaxID=47885 RepID=UPI002893B152|nr:hypothetical protein [Pseudomonas oryzihabitans]MDT3722930.1 hypothetical protein [Pseudomonas oryzihabitans]